MSDPVTNVEIEDVLSSIRRLVSVDSTRTTRRSAPSPEVEQPAVPSKAPVNEKLVLTSDLRVPAEPVEPSSPTPAPKLSPAARAHTTALERRIAELEAAVNAQVTDFEPDGSEDTMQHRPSSVPNLSSRTPVASDSGDGVADLEAFAMDAVMAEAARDEEVAEVENSVVEKDDPMANPSGDVPAESAVPERETGAELSPSDSEILKHLIAAQTEQVVSELTQDDAMTDGAGEDISVFAPEGLRANDKAEGDTTLHFLRSQDGEVKTHDAEEVLEAEHHRRHPFNLSGMEATDGGLGIGMDESVIDEDTLRDLVAEIVREELQGALGERITRNVRKLVRREIMRAISIRDFE